MPVTIYPAPHGANTLSPNIKYSKTAKDLLPYTETSRLKNDNIIQSTFKDLENSNILTISNGFVDGAVHAYNDHHRLSIRPEDIWFSILTQFNFYVNANSEKLRSLFVAHEGQKVLMIEDLSDIKSRDPNAVFGVDWGKFSFKMTRMVAENIKDASFREWILPTFTTTTKDDQTIASIIMMSTLQKYFTYGCRITCGLPSVNLLGEKSDWEQILSKIERLSTFGDEPTQWLTLLRPVIRHFVASFDEPEGEEVKNFWQKIVHYSGGGSGPTYLSGWITAFCFWGSEGKCYRRFDYNPPVKGDSMRSMGKPTPVLELDDARYHRIETDQVPPGTASVPVKLYSNMRIVTETIMFAGSLGISVSSSEKDLHGKPGEKGLDTITPVTGWFMYETKSEDELAAEKKAKEEEQRLWMEKKRASWGLELRRPS